MAKIRITQSRSVIKSSDRQKKTMQALGLRNRHQVVELEESPAVQGMIEKVRHLVHIEKKK
jgi:large subunit ribosomal protein L30